MLISAANSESLYKTYDYSNGKLEENVVYKNNCIYTGLDKIEISKDSPEYETICGQMRSLESFGSLSLGNQLFYDANEIMYDYYDGKLTEEDVKTFFKDYLYNSVGKAEENNTYQQKQVTVNLSRIYEMFTRGNVRNAVNQNQKEGQQFLKEHGLDSQNEFYYNAKWYWKSEDMQQLFKDAANEIAEEYGAEQVDFEAVIENSKYTLEGGLSYNAVWNWMNWQTNRPSPLGDDNYLEEDFVPPENFIYCSGNTYRTDINDTEIEENVKELTGKELLNYIYLYHYEEYGKMSTDSFWLDKNNYVEVKDILKNFHIQYFSESRYEFLWMEDKGDNIWKKNS